MTGSHVAFLSCVALLSSHQVSAQYPDEAGSCFDPSSGSVFAWNIPDDAEERSSFTNGDADLVFNRPTNFILDPDSEVPVKLRPGGRYPIDILVPNNEPFTSALLRIEGQGTLEPGTNSQEVSCGPGVQGVVSRGDGEQTEMGGEYTVDEDAQGDILVDATLVYEDDEGDVSYAYEQYMLGVVADTEAPVVAPTEGPTTAPTIAPTTSPTMAPTTSPTMQPTKKAVVVGPGLGAGAPTIAPTATNREVVAPPPGTTANGPTSPPTVSPTTVQERVSSQVGTPATGGTTPSTCSVCTGTMVLGDLEQVFRVDRLPFNCRDIEERSELFDPTFCVENMSTILDVCGGCVPAPIPVPPPTPMPTLGPITEQAPTSGASGQALISLLVSSIILWASTSLVM